MNLMGLVAGLYYLCAMVTALSVMVRSLLVCFIVLSALAWAGCTWMLLMAVVPAKLLAVLLTPHPVSVSSRLLHLSETPLVGHLCDP